MFDECVSVDWGAVHVCHSIRACIAEGPYFLGEVGIVHKSPDGGCWGGEVQALYFLEAWAGVVEV